MPVNVGTTRDNPIVSGFRNIKYGMSFAMTAERNGLNDYRLNSTTITHGNIRFTSY